MHNYREWEWKFYGDSGDLVEIWNYENWKQIWEWTYFKKDWTSTKLIFKDWMPWKWTMYIAQTEFEFNYKDGIELES